MYHLETAIPAVRRLPRLPVSRDQAFLLMIAMNEIFLGLDTYLSHVLNGTIRPNEWIPILFGPLAGLILLLAGLIALRRRPLASTLATLTLLASMVVGVLGAYFHLVRGILPTGPVGRQITVDLLIFAPPILGPLYFTLVGLLGISAAWEEDPPDSGILRVSSGWKWHLPYPKTQAYFFIVAMGILAALISSVLDHARSHFADPWFWLPTAVGIFALVTAVMLGAIIRPTRADLLTYIVAMLLLSVVGVIGMILHVSTNLTTAGVIVTERFLRGAPFLAPLLFSNMGMLGLIVLLDPTEQRS